MATVKEILKRVKESVKAVAPDAELILYGSHARGDSREDSDIDLLVLVNKEKVTYDDRIKITSPVYGIELDTGRLISLFFYPKKKWAKPDVVTPFYENVIREGVAL